MKTSRCALSLLSCLTACDGCGDNGDQAPTPDIASSACTAPVTFSAVTNLRLSYTADRDAMTAGNQEVWKTLGDMDSTDRPDFLWIELFEGAAPDYTTLDFPPTPFTVQLAGNELDYLKCSTCISITTNVDPSTLSAGNIDYVDDYQASAGSVTITALTTTQIAGTLENISLRHVDNLATGSVPNASGCTTTLATLPFSATVSQAARATGAGSGEKRTAR